MALKMKSKTIYCFFFCFVVILDLVIFLLYHLNFFEPLTIFFIALIFSGIAVVFLIKFNDFFNDHLLFGSYSLIFIILPWILYAGLLVEKSIILDYILSDIAFYVIFSILIPIIIIDYSLYQSKEGRESKDRIQNLKSTLKRSFFFIIFVIFVIAVYFFIGLIYYNIVNPLYINISTAIFNLIALTYAFKYRSFVKRHILFSVYGIGFMALSLCEFLLGEFSYFLLFIFLIPLPVVGIIEFLILRRTTKIKIEKGSKYQEIPNITNLIRNYVYHQLRSLTNEFRDIKYDDVDKTVRNQINSRIDGFRNYLKMEGYELSKYEMSLLEKDCIEESTPIRNEVKELIKTRVSHELFGDELVGKYKTIEESIDALLNEYRDWEISKEGKRST